jgi:rfaE bifunctional protein nucleotidyltransferase chain/domain
MTSDFLDNYKHKILDSKALAELVGNRPRKRKVVMCHGVFDVVHPGHIRHFLYAKSKADLLIVSLTADKHINKGENRPHVPEDLRALNLAALDFVDYVLIDPSETPIENIKQIEPDIFAKGFEYSPTNKLIEKTSLEIATVNSYGGEIIFTPGDFILSSSRYINETPPNLRIEKLLMLMKRSGIAFSEIRSALEKIGSHHVHVIGDTIIDSYTRCSMIGGQTKTPTMSVRFESQVDLVGGAGIVAAHLKAAGAKVSISTILGKDKFGDLARNKFSEWQIEDFSIVDSNKPTTNKNAIVVNDYRLLKVDTVDNSPISNFQLNAFVATIAESKANAFVLSDFRHGIFSKRTIDSLVEAIPRDAFKVADSQVASRWGNILDFKGFDLITPNERSLCSNLFSASKSKVLIMKLADKGIITCTSEDATTLDSYFVMDSFVNNLVDPVGAGDALLAYATLAMLTTKNPVIASILGNFAAACECELDGNVPIAKANILAKINEVEDSVNFVYR